MGRANLCEGRVFQPEAGPNRALNGRSDFGGTVNIWTEFSDDLLSTHVDMFGV